MNKLEQFSGLPELPDNPLGDNSSEIEGKRKRDGDSIEDQAPVSKKIDFNRASHLSSARGGKSDTVSSKFGSIKKASLSRAKNTMSPVGGTVADDSKVAQAIKARGSISNKRRSFKGKPNDLKVTSSPHSSHSSLPVFPTVNDPVIETAIINAPANVLNLQAIQVLEPKGKETLVEQEPVKKEQLVKEPFWVTKEANGAQNDYQVSSSFNSLPS
jgi:hypothetical protein